jgi:hypothetical protein
MASRGQIGIEFFLVLGFALSIVGVLIMNSERGLEGNTRLDSAMLSLAAVNTVSNSINTAFLQGNGTLIRTQVFVPYGARCFVVNPATSALFCDVGDPQGRVVNGMSLYAVPTNVSDSCYSMTGWMAVKVNNSKEFGMGVFCSPLP